MASIIIPRAGGGGLPSASPIAAPQDTFGHAIPAVVPQAKPTADVYGAAQGQANIEVGKGFGVVADAIGKQILRDQLLQQSEEGQTYDVKKAQAQVEYEAAKAARLQEGLSTAETKANIDADRQKIFGKVADLKSTFKTNVADKINSDLAIHEAKNAISLLPEMEKYSVDKNKKQEKEKEDAISQRGILGNDPNAAAQEFDAMYSTQESIALHGDKGAAILAREAKSDMAEKRLSLQIAQGKSKTVIELLSLPENDIRKPYWIKSLDPLKQPKLLLEAQNAFKNKKELDMKANEDAEEDKARRSDTDGKIPTGPSSDKAFREEMYGTSSSIPLSTQDKKPTNATTPSAQKVPQSVTDKEIKVLRKWIFEKNTVEVRGLQSSLQKGVNEGSKPHYDLLKEMYENNPTMFNKLSPDLQLVAREYSGVNPKSIEKIKEEQEIVSKQTDTERKKALEDFRDKEKGGLQVTKIIISRTGSSLGVIGRFGASVVNSVIGDKSSVTKSLGEFSDAGADIYWKEKTNNPYGVPTDEFKTEFEQAMRDGRASTGTVDGALDYAKNRMDSLFVVSKWGYKKTSMSSAEREEYKKATGFYPPDPKTTLMRYDQAPESFSNGKTPPWMVAQIEYQIKQYNIKPLKPGEDYFLEPITSTPNKNDYYVHRVKDNTKIGRERGTDKKEIIISIDKTKTPEYQQFQQRITNARNSALTEEDKQYLEAINNAGSTREQIEYVDGIIAMAQSELETTTDKKRAQLITEELNKLKKEKDILHEEEKSWFRRGKVQLKKRGT